MTPLPAVETKTEKKAKELFPLANIMVATDFSPASARAVDYAVSLARRFGSRVFLVHILEYERRAELEAGLSVPPINAFRIQAEERMKALEESGRLFGVPYIPLIDTGMLWPAIEQLIDQHQIDLLVVGTHGAGAISKVFIGSRAEQIFRHARIPVLTVGPQAKEEPLFEAEFKTILCATDFGLAAEREAAYAFALAQEHRAKLLLLHVCTPREGLSERDVVFEREEIVRTLKELIPAGYEPTCKQEFHLAFGEPVEQILRVTEEMKADLIVIGAKKQGAFAGHIPHTMASRIVCGAKCPVLTVKT